MATDKRTKAQLLTELEVSEVVRESMDGELQVSRNEILRLRNRLKHAELVIGAYVLDELQSESDVYSTRVLQAIRNYKRHHSNTETGIC